MISIKRTPHDYSFTSDGFKKKLAREKKSVEAHVMVKKTVQGFTFSCYKHQEVKDRLKEIFNGKCAYCDSSILHVASGDVEHFRPKSIYWWFGYEWHNLLFACELCNRSNKNANFPLVGNATTQCKPNDHIAFDHEEKNLRLLLNPCIENPENYFEYDLIHGFIKPHSLLKAGTREHEMARTSIAVYGLQRKDLVVERRKHLILLNAQIDSVESAIVNYNLSFKNTLSVKSYFKAVLRRELKKLHLYIEADQPFVGLSKQRVRQFYNRAGLSAPF